MKKIMMAVGAALMAGMTMADTSFAYQGMLRDSKGAVKEGLTDAAIYFRLYTDPTADAAVWGQKVSVRLGTNGLFNVELSDSAGTPCVDGAAALDTVITDSQKAGLPLYLGLTVEGSAGEIRPRQKLIPSPMTAYAQNVSEAKGDFSVAGNAVFNGNLSMKTKGSVISADKMEVVDLSVSGKTTFSSGMTASSAQVTGDVTISGELTVNGVNPGVPIGCIVMWSGKASEIPNGWGLCDGTTYQGSKKNVVSPDLRGRFVVGVNTDIESAPDGKTHSRNKNFSEYKITDESTRVGGEEKHTLTTQEMPRHNHGPSQEWGSAGTEKYKRDNGAWPTTNPDIGQGFGDWDYKMVTDYAGGDANGNTVAHENRPPYYALCFIIKYK